MSVPSHPGTAGGEASPRVGQPGGTCDGTNGANDGSRQRLSDELADRVAHWIAALADPVRARLVDRLTGGGCTVAELTAGLPTTQQNVSRHLSRLHAVGIVSRQRVGARVRYDIASPTAVEILDLVATEVVRHLEHEALTVRRTLV